MLQLMGGYCRIKNQMVEVKKIINIDSLQNKLLHKTVGKQLIAQHS